MNVEEELIKFNQEEYFKNVGQKLQAVLQQSLENLESQLEDKSVAKKSVLKSGIKKIQKQITENYQKAVDKIEKYSQQNFFHNKIIDELMKKESEEKDEKQKLEEMKVQIKGRLKDSIQQQQENLYKQIQEMIDKAIVEQIQNDKNRLNEMQQIKENIKTFDDNLEQLKLAYQELISTKERM